jgi:hypothetical protein
MQWSFVYLWSKVNRRIFKKVLGKLKLKMIKFLQYRGFLKLNCVKKYKKLILKNIGKQMDTEFLSRLSSLLKGHSHEIDF